PADRNTSSSVCPFSRSVFSPWRTSVVAGTTKVSILTVLPFKTRAAARKSVILPPVQEPMYARSSFVPRISLTAARVSWLCGVGIGAVRLGDDRLQLRHVVRLLEDERRPRVARHRGEGPAAPVADLDVVERHPVRRDDAVLAAGLDHHVAQRHALLNVQRV